MRQNVTKKNTRKLHAFRCETCDRRIGYGMSDDCPIGIPAHLDDPNVYVIERVGCASYSSGKKNELEGWDSTRIIGNVEERFDQLRRKNWDWSSFYNGWLEGRAAMLSELRNGEKK